MSMSELRKRIGVLINIIDGNLSEYLSSNDYQIREHGEVHILDNSNRNVGLLKKRISNVITVQTDLRELLSRLPDDMTSEQLLQTLPQVQARLIKGLEKNNQLSAQYGKVHFSFKQNRLAGFGLFSSWFNKTWFQSRAARAFEKSLDQLDGLTHQFTKKPIPANPPPYAPRSNIL